MVAVVTDSTSAVLVEKWQRGGSNNIAELWAVQEALTWATEKGHETVQVYTDSRNNFAWVNGKIGKKLNDRAAVLGLYHRINELRKRVEVELVWVPRQDNVAGWYIERTVGL